MGTDTPTLVGDDNSTEPRTYTVGGGWGCHVEWMTPHAKVWGHQPRRPRKGDRIHSAMQSGRTGVYEVVEVEYCWDLDDMFFADVTPLGYLDELEASGMSGE